MITTKRQATTRADSRQGLSFLEALMTLFLVGLVVVMMAFLLSETSRMGRRNQVGEQTVNGLAAFERVRAEVAEALVIQAPLSGGSFEEELRFQKVDPNATNRFPTGVSTWTPAAASTRLTVRYREENRQLVRYSQAASQPEVRTVLADQVEAFSAAWDGAAEVTLKISFERGKVLEAYESSVRRYLP